MGLMEKFADPELMHSLSFGEKMQGAGITTLMGMGVTFAVLLLLWGCLALMTKITSRAAAKPSGIKTPAAKPAEAGTVATDKTEIAVIMAAIAAYEGDTVNNLIVRKINRVSGKTTAWGNAGRSDCIESRKF